MRPMRTLFKSFWLPFGWKLPRHRRVSINPACNGINAYPSPLRASFAGSQGKANHCSLPRGVAVVGSNLPSIPCRYRQMEARLIMDKDESLSSKAPPNPLFKSLSEIDSVQLHLSLSLFRVVGNGKTCPKLPVGALQHYSPECSDCPDGEPV